MKEQKNSAKHEKYMSVLSVASMVLIFLLLVFLFIFALYKLNVIMLPEELAKFFGINQGNEVTVIPGDDGKIYDALKSGEYDGYGTVEYDISSVDAYEALKKSQSKQCYTAKFTVTLTEAGESRERKLKIWRDGEKYRIECFEGGTLVQTAVCDGERTMLCDHVTFNSDTVHIYEKADSFDFEAEAMIPKISEIFDSEDVKNLNISILRTEDNNVYLAQYEKPKYSCKEIRYISLEYGLILRAESSDGNGTYYTFTTDELSSGLISEDMDIDGLFTINEE